MISARPRFTLEQAFAEGLLRAELTGCSGFDQTAFAATFAAEILRAERERAGTLQLKSETRNLS